MTKLNLWIKVTEKSYKLTALCNSVKRESKTDARKLTCKDLQRMGKAFDTLYELMDKCIIKEAKNE